MLILYTYTCKGTMSTGKEHTTGILKIKIKTKNFPQNNQNIQTNNSELSFYLSLCIILLYNKLYFNLFLFNQTVLNPLKNLL